MFKLFLLVTVLSSQASMQFEHIKSPFPSHEACLAAIEKTRAQTMAFFEEQLGPVRTDYECLPAGAALNKDDRAADDIVRTFRTMIRQGGFGSSPENR
jgi:hypothetical protein